MEAGQPPAGPGGPPPGGPGGEAPPQTEEELRARLEEEMRRVRVQDLVLQSVASLVNLTARRIAKEDEQDLDQARIGIEAVRGLVDLLEPEPQQQVREALSELQMLYSQAAGGGLQEAPPEGDAGGGEGEAQPSPQQAPPQQQQPPQQQGPGQGQAPPRLWTPHQRD